MIGTSFFQFDPCYFIKQPFTRCSLLVSLQPSLTISAYSKHERPRDLYISVFLVNVNLIGLSIFKRFEAF